MSSTTFTSSDESSHCSALQKHSKEEGGRDARQDWGGNARCLWWMAPCPGSCRANARSGTFTASAGSLEVLNYRWIPNFLEPCCSAAMQSPLATCVFFILKLKPWWETSLCDRLAQQLKMYFSTFIPSLPEISSIPALCSPFKCKKLHQHHNWLQTAIFKSKNWKSYGVQSNWKKILWTNPVKKLRGWLLRFKWQPRCLPYCKHRR